MIRVGSFFSSVPAVFLSAVLLRTVLLIYGHIQDQHSALKYTDIDYFVFTDAARYVSNNLSPYLRDTYRYTPLLAWLLVPTAWGGLWFDFGKALFAASDIVAGWLIFIILRSVNGMSIPRSLKYSSLWLLNPMVAQISTRGSSEGLLAVMVMALLWSTLRAKYTLTGVLLGLAVHFKIYPFVYAASIFWWLENTSRQKRMRSSGKQAFGIMDMVKDFWNVSRLNLAFSSFVTFMALNVAMFYIYGNQFVRETYLYHVVRSDHRHNFSPYHLLLYLNSSPAAESQLYPESLAFLPQLFLSAIAIPLVTAKNDLPSCMLAQTFAFVTFNKVCTSQYFLWYMVFLPFYLPSSTMLRRPQVGLIALVLWVVGQAMWLQQGFQLEFIGQSTFMPGLWVASLVFFVINTWILGLVVSDVRGTAPSAIVASAKKRA